MRSIGGMSQPTRTIPPDPPSAEGGTQADPTASHPLRDEGGRCAASGGCHGQHEPSPSIPLPAEGERQADAAASHRLPAKGEGKPTPLSLTPFGTKGVDARHRGDVTANTNHPPRSPCLRKEEDKLIPPLLIPFGTKEVARGARGGGMPWFAADSKLVEHRAPCARRDAPPLRPGPPPESAHR